MVMKRWR